MKFTDNYRFENKKTLIRVDFNVPLNKAFEITDDTRIRAAIPTIRKVLDGGGSAILLSHLGRPKQGPEERFSLRHLVGCLSDIFHTKVAFAPDCIGEEALNMAATLKSGEILLLENVRFHPEEIQNDESFARKLAVMGDVYINDAFGTIHRAHASTFQIAKFVPDKLCGDLIRKEMEAIGRVLDHPQRPVTAIIGGAKISDKIQMIEKLLDKIDNLIIGGGMTYTFFKGLGGMIGSSLVEPEQIEYSKKLLVKAKEKGVHFLLPIDSIVANAFDNQAKTQVLSNAEIRKGWRGLDIGPRARKEFAEVIEASKTILWNGPMGVFEMPNFAGGTKSVAESIVKATQNGAFSLIGGGDSVAAVSKLGYTEQVSYISTGGGALLRYIEGEELPGLKALEG